MRLVDACTPYRGRIYQPITMPKVCRRDRAVGLDVVENEPKKHFCFDLESSFAYQGSKFKARKNKQSAATWPYNAIASFRFSLL
jgi:hypothetical protein